MHKALNNILQHYLRQETLVTSENGQVDEELLESLHKCLEDKGVLKEVHAFLRQRLVAVLQGTWPQLFDHFRSDYDFNPVVLKLLEDFLCSHKLLFTLSILTTELGDAFCPKPGFAKLSSLDAEALLFNLGIRPDTGLSHKILQSYAAVGSKESLFETLISLLPHTTSRLEDKSNGTREEIRSKNILTLDANLKKIDDKKRRISKPPNVSAEERFRHLALELERDKQIQLQIAIERYKTEEVEKIREEIETAQKFELVRKENELLSNFEQKVLHLTKTLEREKELWLAQRELIERDILDKKQQLQTVELKSRKNFVEGSTQTDQPFEPFEKPGEDLPQFSFPRNAEQRQFERTYLMREAKLKVEIEQLVEENRLLKAQPNFKPAKEPELVASESDMDSSRPRLHQWRHRVSDQKRPPHRQRSPEKRQSLEKVPIQRHDVNTTTNAYADTVAFLQYQLEYQSEEIEKLRHAVTQNESSGKPVSFQSPAAVATSPRIPKVLETSDVDTFLKAAKERILDIEQEAQLVEETVHRIHNPNATVSSSRPRSPPPRSLFPLRRLQPIHQPQLAPAQFIPRLSSVPSRTTGDFPTATLRHKLKSNQGPCPEQIDQDLQFGVDTEKGQGDIDKSSGEDWAPKEKVAQSGNLSDENLSLESSIEKASRSGALVKNKVGPRSVSGSDSISSTTFKSSAVFKSVEKAEGERRFKEDCPSNRIFSFDSPLSATFNKEEDKNGMRPQPHHDPSKREQDPGPNTFFEEDLDDLGTIETSEDLVVEENLFWKM